MRKFILVFIIFLGFLNAQNRVITTGVPFLMISPDARAAGMGELGVATSADAYSQQWNPAKYIFSSSGIYRYPKGFFFSSKDVLNQQISRSR